MRNYKTIYIHNEIRNKNFKYAFYHKNKYFIGILLSILFMFYFINIPIFSENMVVFANQTDITSQVNIAAKTNKNDSSVSKQSTNYSGYDIYIDDKADLLSSSEEKELTETMQHICNYGHVVFVSISENPYHDTEDYARNYYDNQFGNASGVIFLVDMDERYIYIYSNGEIHNTITNAYANTITDNVYTYASDDDYFTCANEAFGQMLTLLEGHKIAQPMKYISNALLAIAIALMINYFVVMSCSKKRKASNKELLDGIYSHVEIKNPNVQFLHQTRRHVPRNPPPSSGGKTGRPSGGGGSHGGGGGHHF